MKSKKFTIMELLVVIAIIAILISLLMPMVGRVRTRAVKTKAKAEMHSIITAVKSYEMTYGILPLPDGCTGEVAYGDGETQYPNLMTWLTNVPYTVTDQDATVTGNGRGIRFLDVPDKYSSKGFVDPWGKDFTILLDTDYDGEIVPPSGTPTDESKLYGSIFVYSWVGDGSAPADLTSSDFVCSWK